MQVCMLNCGKASHITDKKRRETQQSYLIVSYNSYHAASYLRRIATGTRPRGNYSRALVRRETQTAFSYSLSLVHWAWGSGRLVEMYIDFGVRPPDSLWGVAALHLNIWRHFRVSSQEYQPGKGGQHAAVIIVRPPLSGSAQIWRRARRETAPAPPARSRAAPAVPNN